ncbi:MAG: hypothetical protein RL134_2541 [Actinomycetota bacterium]|jgi:hypothetical protein
MTAAPHLAFRGLGLNGKTSKLDIIKFATGGFWLDADHVLHGPGVLYKPLPEAATQPKITPRNVILHSQAAPTKIPWWNAWAYWNRGDITGEAHTLCNLDGTIIQAMPFNVRADNNYKGNSWTHLGNRYGALSCETQDFGAASLQTTPWAQQQFHALVAMTTVQCVAYRIACTAPTTWDDTGIGYHSQFKEWSIYVGKTCPGQQRIRQMDELRRQVASRVAAFYEGAGGTCPTKGA